MNAGHTSLNLNASKLMTDDSNLNSELGPTIYSINQPITVRHSNIDSQRSRFNNSINLSGNDFYIRPYPGLSFEFENSDWYTK